MKNFILQAVTKQNHINVINALLDTDGIDDFIISTAFMTNSGISTIEEKLVKVAAKTTFFVGVRNGITTYQSLEKAISIGCEVYAVDTGARSPIFHPKMYFGIGKENAELVIGSANLTVGGLNSNIEASLHQTLSHCNEDDEKLILEIKSNFTQMVIDFPQHVFKIENINQIDDLLNTGRIIDEEGLKTPLINSSSDARNDDDLGRMKLKTKPIGLSKTTAQTAAIPIKTNPKTNTGKLISPTNCGLELLWESSPLVRRDLGIPRSVGTNPTGSMLLKKGNSEIDQQSYFRDEVFNGLQWRPNRQTLGKELADASFQFVIRGIDYGIYRITVSNDTRKDTTSFRQKQPMCEIRWGEARNLIARDDLLERVMKLYRDTDDFTQFIIDID